MYLFYVLKQFKLLKNKSELLLNTNWQLLIRVSLSVSSIIIQAHGDKFAAKRMRRLTQRRAVDYTSTVVRYMQELQFHQTPLLQFLLLPICRIPWLQLLVLLQTH
ncbi:hypothetical protein ERO13_A06G138202v2 [Gossypium hirsutum]|uniref:Uncharacterized protein LOC107893944 isoform X2 n=2 Tax=Gossypium TaxID=3633 RepID=A0A1U8NCN9_GOSHI|nr:uncharacterized protein LOC107893944 isoform X2 [Gossypium hirsutum]XP_016675458.1 uncharacterized protein LOC107894725 isoform X2 [Gossypium hirsutum]XP_016707159.1 uncharacterized protein LOC107921828 isoform X3 [Gossypium hirsutum]TYG50804.1 hypothetical protein ES288_D10G205200v1 [Gossypium darwinii]KAG4166186.1 hypothetical protein ERO13_A13G115550v2 [Gossypium hirsutum]KAG4195137.1 hypothetical protein ERO13_A06G138202v2 [Gossypium hirsutum]TYH17482.1 hypothetical protein ES288_A05G1